MLLMESLCESISNMCELLLLYLGFTNITLLPLVEVLTWTCVAVAMSWQGEQGAWTPLPFSLSDRELLCS